MVAQYADGCNLAGDVDRAKHLLGVLDGHCEAVGRDPAQITKTVMVLAAVAPTKEEAQHAIEAAVQRGLPPERAASYLAADADALGEVAEGYRGVGVEGITLVLANAHDPDAVRAAGQTLAGTFTAR